MMRALLPLLCVLACTSCKSKAQPKPAALPSAETPVAAQATNVVAPAKNEGARGTRRLQEVGVYVDGKPLGVLRATELPPGLAPRNPATLHYPFNAYAKLIGVDVSRVRAIHLHGGSRVSMVAGDEFRRMKDRLTFSFSAGDHGKPRVHYPAQKLEANTTVDMLSRVAFYVDKAPPTYRDGTVYMPDGAEVKGIAYGDEDPGFGTRTYLDGRLVNVLKRRKQASAEMTLAEHAKTLGVDPSRLRGVEVASGDNLVARLGIQDFSTVSFGLPGKTHGVAVVDLSGAHGAKNVRATSFAYFTTSPSARALDPEAAETSDPTPEEPSL